MNALLGPIRLLGNMISLKNNYSICGKCEDAKKDVNNGKQGEGVFEEGSSRGDDVCATS